MHQNKPHFIAGIFLAIPQTILKLIKSLKYKKF